VQALKDHEKLFDIAHVDADAIIAHPENDFGAIVTRTRSMLASSRVSRFARRSIAGCAPQAQHLGSPAPWQRLHVQ
jgi:hypothetical protein